MIFSFFHLQLFELPVVMGEKQGDRAVLLLGEKGEEEVVMREEVR